MTRDRRVHGPGYGPGEDVAGTAGSDTGPDHGDPVWRKPVHGDHPVHGYIAEGDKDALSRRMHRIEGQVRGIEKMIADDRYCIDILTQVSAVSTALEAVALLILEDHVNHCVAGALASGDGNVATEKAAELLEAVRRFARAR